MQLLPPLTSDRRTIAREKSAGVHLPYARHVDDHTIETRDGLLMQVIQLRGLLFETADTDEINYRKVLRDAMLQAIGSSRFAIYHHVIRREADAELSDKFPDDFSTRLDAAWRARLSARKLYVNDFFLTLVRRPMQGRVGMADRIRGWFGSTGVDPDVTRSHEVHQLDTARDALLAQLGSYGPRLLSVYETKAGFCSEPLEFLSALYNAEMRPVLMPKQDAGAYIPYRRVSFGEETVELGPAGHTPRSFVGMVSIKDYPAQTAPGMLDELLRLPFEITVSQSFGFVDRQAALGKMNLALRRMRSAEDEAVSLRAELSNAKDDVAAGRGGVAVQVDDELVHAHPAVQGPAPAADRHLGAVARRARDALAVPDRDQADRGRLLGDPALAVGDGVAGCEVLDREQRCGGVGGQEVLRQFGNTRHQARTFVCLGSNASRRPSPMKLTARESDTSTMNGPQNSHGRFRNCP